MKRIVLIYSTWILFIVGLIALTVKENYKATLIILILIVCLEQMSAKIEKIGGRK